MSRTFKFYDRAHRPEINYPKMTGEYTSYEIKQEKKSTGPGVDDFEVIDVTIEKKTNIEEFISSFKDVAGVDAVLKKVALGDMSQIGVGEHGDETIIPEDPEEALKLAKDVEEAFSKLDPELTEGQSLQEFIDKLSDERIKAYLEKKAAALKAQEEGNK